MYSIGGFDPIKRLDRPAKDTPKPRIDWGIKSEIDSTDTRRYDRAEARWTEDFVNHLGKDKNQREPNAGFRLIVPETATKVVADTARRISALFR